MQQHASMPASCWVPAHLAPAAVLWAAAARHSCITTEQQRQAGGSKAGVEELACITVPAGDLANMDALDPESAAKLPALMALRGAIYSPEFRQ